MSGDKVPWREAKELREEISALRAKLMALQGSIVEQEIRAADAQRKRSVPLSRLEAAERAIVEAAEILVDHHRGVQARGVAIAKADVSMPDLVDQLRRVRSEIAASVPRCQASVILGTVQRSPGTVEFNGPVFGTGTMTFDGPLFGPDSRHRCELPAGHEGEHVTHEPVEWKWLE